MGVGKTTTSKELLKMLPNSVFLDGDWVWYSYPVITNEETFKMAEQNMSFVLNNFLACSAYENIIFCSVMYKEVNIDDILSMIANKHYNLFKFSLVCSKNVLSERIAKDTSGNLVRGSTATDQAISLLSNYTDMNTIKIDVGELAPKQAANAIFNIVC